MTISTITGILNGQVANLTLNTAFEVEQGESYYADFNQVVTLLTGNGFIDSGVPFTSADHTKLDGIETAATADQTGAEIKTAYEAESDTNAFTDAEKTSLSTALQNIVEDTTPQLGGDLDANGNNVMFDDATGILDANGNELLQFQTIASAVNYLDLQNAATGVSPRLLATGTDTNVGAIWDTKGTGVHLFRTGGTTRCFFDATGLTLPTGHGITVGTPTITSGTGVPSASEPNGSLFLRTDGGVGSTIYKRESGSWSAL